MLDVKTIKNYALALIEDAKALHNEEETLKQIKNVVNIIEAAGSEFQKALYSPVISKSDKFQMIEKLCLNIEVNASLKNFLLMLVKNSRENVLACIVSTYEEILNHNKDIKLVHVKSFKKIEESDKLELEKYLERDLIKHKVKVTYEQDNSILGGILVQYDNKVADFTIAGALRKIENIATRTVIN